MTQPNVLEVLRRHAIGRADECAYDTPHRRWTFAFLHEHSNRLAQGLASLGIGHGDRVATLSKHTADTAALWMAAAKLGAVCMPVNWRLAAPEIEYILRDGEARLLMADAPFAATLDAVNAPSLLQTIGTHEGFGPHPGAMPWAAGFAADDPGYSPSMEDTALQLYSSGTTGLPKGVELSYGNLAANLEALPDAIGYHGPPALMLNALPAFHIAGIGVALVTGALGARLVLLPDFDPVKVLDTFERERITHSFLVPAMIQFLLEVPGVEKRDFSSLRGISYGAAPITERVLIDGMRVFGCGFTQVYGLTETTGAITHLPPEMHGVEDRLRPLLRSAGKPMAGVQLRIVGPDGADCVAGEVGEVWIRSRQNMRRYWRRPEATEAVFVADPAGDPPWFRSGDAGYLKDGVLFLHDRIKDMIISGGENIYPAEVENVLMLHPAVADGAVFGIPDERWGETVKAAVVPRDRAAFDPDAVIAFMRERLAHFKCPRSIDVLDAIPRNPSGKILKRVLRAPYWEGHDRGIA